MKDAFLELIEDVKKARIADTLCKISNAAEFREIWKKILNENSKLCAKIEKWLQMYKETGSKNIFKDGENVQNPMEVVIIFFIIGDDYEGIECKVFERWEDLAEMVCRYDNEFAQSISYNIRRAHISNITAEEIFPKKENETGF